MKKNHIRKSHLIIVVRISIVLAGSIILTRLSLDVFNIYFPNFNCSYRSGALLLSTFIWALIVSLLLRYISRPPSYQDIEDINTDIPSVYEVGGGKELNEFIQSFTESDYYTAIESIINFLNSKDSSGATLVINGPHRSGKTTITACAAKLHNNSEPYGPFLGSLKTLLNIYGIQGQEEVNFIYEPALRFNDMNEYMINMYSRLIENNDLLEIIEGLAKKDLRTVLSQLISRTSTIHNKNRLRDSVLIIDDIDRLNPNEIITILKLKLLVEQKKINNFKLVLIWDEDNLLRVLKSEYPYIDRRYLDKYIDPIATKQISLGSYGQLWEHIVTRLAQSRNVDKDYIMACIMEEELCKEFEAVLTQDIKSYDIPYIKLRNEILDKSRALGLKNFRLIQSYTNLPIFQSPNRIYDFDFKKPISSLYGDDVSLMLCQFRAGGCLLTNHANCKRDTNGNCILQCKGHDGLYCETIFNSQYIPRWSSTIKVINYLKGLSEADLAEKRNIRPHCPQQPSLPEPGVYPGSQEA